MQSDQKTRADFAAVQADPTLDAGKKNFFSDLETAYNSFGYLQSSVQLAQTDPQEFQDSVTPPTDSLVGANAGQQVFFPAIAAAGAGTTAAATGSAQASLAGAVTTGRVTYDPATDSFISASEGVLAGSVVRALNLATSGMSAATDAFVSTLTTQYPLLTSWLLTAAAVAANSSEGSSPKPPAGSLPIDQTPWSGDHQGIKGAIGAGPAEDVRISPDGDVWSQNPDGTWTDNGPASTLRDRDDEVEERAEIAIEGARKTCRNNFRTWCSDSS